jgi:uncharacterized protein (DUF4213/DUF364 family)
LPVIERILAEAVATPGAGTASTLEVRVGPYWSVVRTSAGAGLASTMADFEEHQGPPIRHAGSLHTLAPVKLAQLLRSPSPPEAAVGLAAINALLAPLAAGAVDGNARELLCERAEGRLLAVVGHFPFTDRLRAVCRELWVFERAGRLRPGDLEESSMDELLPHAEVVAVTGSAVSNHTLETIVGRMRARLCNHGPSTPLASCLFGWLRCSAAPGWRTRRRSRAAPRARPPTRSGVLRVPVLRRRSTSCTSDGLSAIPATRA